MSRYSVETSYLCDEVFKKLSSILGGGVADASEASNRTAEENHFCLFIKILLGEVKENASPSQSVNGEKLVTSTPFFWLPSYLAKRKGIPDINHLQALRMAFKEVMRHRSLSAEVGFVFAKMPLQHVEDLLEYPEDLRSTLNGVARELERRKRVVVEPKHEKGLAARHKGLAARQKGVGAEPQRKRRK